MARSGLKHGGGRGGGQTGENVCNRGLALGGLAADVTGDTGRLTADVQRRVGWTDRWTDGGQGGFDILCRHLSPSRFQLLLKLDDWNVR